MRKICPKCNGNGYHSEPIEAVDWWLAPLCLGASLLKNNISCKVCDGAGYVESN